MGYTVSKLLDIARAEIGYCEKETNSQLDDNTANSGDGNYTKFARDLHAAGYYQASKQGYAWCDMFVDWCFYQLADKDAKKAQEIICQTGLYGAGCEWSAKYYKQQGRFYTSNPEPGDQIFFNNYAHTGIVEKVTSTQVVTIEGNTSNMVARRYYAINSNTIDGYGRPKFDSESTSTSTNATTISGTESTGSAADEKSIWDFLIGKIGNAYGVAGLMGNLYAESALRSNNLQQSYEAKLGYDDAKYTAAVDSGAYGGFVRDSAGYGLAQWTFYSRKQALLNYAKSKNKSIGDLNMQLEFLYKELSESYNNVLNDLKNATSILVASNSVLTKFERPADQSVSVQNKRASYGQKYYDKYVGQATTANPSAGSSTNSEGNVVQFAVGDIVNFTGSTHYTSANASVGVGTKSSKAKITSVANGAKHPYHCRAVNDLGNFKSGVYGWVDANDIEAISTEVVSPSVPSTPSISAEQTYIVKSGDTLSKIALKYHTTVKALADYNGIQNPNLIRVNQVIRIPGSGQADWVPEEGDIVVFNGNTHYSSANASTGSNCQGGKAKITDIYQLGKSKHPYHLVRIAGGGATVYGWVDEGTFSKA